MNERKISKYLALLIIILVIPLIFTCNSNLTLALDEKMESSDPSPPGFLDEAGKTIIFDDIRATAVDLSWIKAQDDLAEQDELEYSIIYSLSDDIDTAETALENGTVALDWTADISSGSVSGLTILTTYYFNILVRDKAGNSSAYTAASVKTKNDTVLPTPGDEGTLTIGNINTENFTVSWTKGTDDISPEGKLQYLVYYTIVQANSGDEVVSSGTAFGDWTADISSIQVTGVLDNVKYYVTVVVKDEVGNQKAYGYDVETTSKKQLFYWTDPGQNLIQRADYAGSNVESVTSVISVQYPNGIAVDPLRRRIYWSEYGDTAKICYSGFDTGNTTPTDLVTIGLNEPAGIAVDYVNEILFWVDTGDNIIYKLDLSAAVISNEANDHVFLTNSAPGNINKPRDITIDILHELIYWCEYDSPADTDMLRESDYSGSSFDIIKAWTSRQPEDLCVIPGLERNGNILYYLDNQSNTLSSCNMSGTEAVLVDSLSYPFSIDADISNRILFWLDIDIDSGNGKIFSYDLNIGNTSLDPDDYDFSFNPGIYLQKIAVY